MGEWHFGSDRYAVTNCGNVELFETIRMLKMDSLHM